MLYVTGDTHGDINRFTDKRCKRLTNKDIVFVCGDFGFVWNSNDKEKRTLKKLTKQKFTIAFVEGAHENFGRLYSYPEEEWYGGTVHRIAPNIVHLTRAQYYNIEGTTVFTMGGGAAEEDSTDSENDWWSTDLPNKGELVAGAANLELHDSKVDIVITHEPSMKIKELMTVSTSQTARINALNAFLEELGEYVDFKKWYFGSLHIDKRITAKKTAMFSNIVEIHKDGEDIIL